MGGETEDQGGEGACQGHTVVCAQLPQDSSVSYVALTLFSLLATLYLAAPTELNTPNRCPKGHERSTGGFQSHKLVMQRAEIAL